MPKDSNRQPPLANRSRDFNIRRYHLSNHLSLSLSLFLSKLPPSSSLSRAHHEWLYRWSAKRTRKKGKEEKEGRIRRGVRGGEKKGREEDFALTRIKRRSVSQRHDFLYRSRRSIGKHAKGIPHDFPRLLDSCRSPANLKYESATKSRRSRRNQLVPRFRETVMTNITYDKCSDGIKFNTHLTSVWKSWTNKIRIF